MAEELLRLLDEYGLRGRAARRRRVVVQSFSREGLQKIHALDPSLPLMQIFSRAETRETILARLDEARTYSIGIGVWKTQVDAELVEAAHARRLLVHTFTVNETSEMETLIAAGVDGTFTDFPDRLEAVLRGEAAQTTRSPGPSSYPAPGAILAERAKRGSATASPLQDNEA